MKESEDEGGIFILLLFAFFLMDFLLWAFWNVQYCFRWAEFQVFPFIHLGSREKVVGRKDLSAGKQQKLPQKKCKLFVGLIIILKNMY